MRILFIGTVDFSYHCLEHLLKRGEMVVAIITRHSDGVNADFRDLSPLARRYRIPIYYVRDINGVEAEGAVQQHQPDVIFCFGWSQLIKPALLHATPYGVIGAHPSRLPMGRGRHPLIWILVLGLKRSALTFFQMDEGADTGDIISQRDFIITGKDNAASLYRKVKMLACRQLDEFLPRLKSGRLVLKKQSSGEGNAWRKRGFLDGQIDWRMSAAAIDNLVRALTVPYPGAHCLYQGRPIRVWKVRKVVCKKNYLEPGKVLSVSGRTITVKVFDGAVRILEHEFKHFPKSGEYLS